MSKGRFVVIEGCDGSGKTTVSTAVFERLKQEGIDVIYTREPGGIDIAEQIRQVILSPKNTAMDVRTEALLYAAGRRQHLVEKIIPALNEGKLVLCDRFVFSSLAYQGYGRQIGIDKVWDINQFAIEGYLPDETIYLQIDAQTGLNRIQSRSYLDRLDQEGIDFHNRVYEGYQQILQTIGKDAKIVDASRDVETVIEETYHLVRDVLQ